jgi:hypothetical protein
VGATGAAGAAQAASIDRISTASRTALIVLKVEERAM